MSEHVDLQQLRAIAASAAPPPPPPPLPTQPALPPVRIAVAKDEAFCFVYNENLRLLQRAGATLLFFSPLRDAAPPDADALYLIGGYPELHAAALAPLHH